ncbi:MAG: hypothetical protein IT289_07195 [Oligoflexia bacterium]|nr:hypothetical protein [Oligoflexia bacterium]
MRLLHKSILGAALSLALMLDASDALAQSTHSYAKNPIDIQKYCVEKFSPSAQAVLFKNVHSLEVWACQRDLGGLIRYVTLNLDQVCERQYGELSIGAGCDSDQNPRSCSCIVRR